MKNYKSVEEEMGINRTIIRGANENPEIVTGIEPFGYSAEKRQEGLNLLSAAEQSIQTQKLEYSEQYVASNAFQEAKGLVEKDFLRFKRIAKHVFSENAEGWKLLRLGEHNPRTYESWYSYVDGLYTVLLSHEALLTAMARFGCTAENVTADQNSLRDLNNMKQNLFTETGEAQRATKDRDQKMEALKQYTNDLVFVLKLAFEGDDAQLLEKLGIIVYS
ncbi:MAG: hypothetical protein JEZ03_06315 [Bacteroidales bacterium]|nr:hypothetical protein [Bacteroidales bacterium]